MRSGRKRDVEQLPGVCPVVGACENETAWFRREATRKAGRVPRPPRAALAAVCTAPGDADGIVGPAAGAVVGLCNRYRGMDEPLS